MDLIKISGIIEFEPILLTKKHENQNEWKKNSLILIGSDICEYYSWFIKKRFNIVLNKPLRGAHVTFINDRFIDIRGDNEEEKISLWNEITKKWNQKEIDIYLNIKNYMSNTKHWWFNVDYDHREEIQSIRNELGLEKPFSGLHMTLGLVNEFNTLQSEYINNLHKNNFIKINDY